MNGKSAGTERVGEQVMLRLTTEERADLERMRREGGEFPHLGPFIRSLLRTIIDDDRAAEVERSTE